ncbi:MAG: hypothetical protein MJK12_08800 [Colwellia sp.]|nr:hypothetical protein [Colwellia sp.]
MKDDFLNDDWLTDQLTEEQLDDDNFSLSTMQLINQQGQATSWYIYAFSAAIVCSLGYLAINVLLALFTDAPIAKPAIIDMQWATIFEHIQVAPISVAVVALTFALIWSIEEFDLL